MKKTVGITAAVLLVACMALLVGCCTQSPITTKKHEALEPVRTVRIHKHCDCGGEFKATGMCYTTFPPSYGHECDKCKTEAYFDEMYPTIGYVTAD